MLKFLYKILILNIILSVICSFSSVFAAAEVFYPVSEIPKELFKDAHLIIREYQTESRLYQKVRL
ncbi:hypothetical protein BH23BAC1_BH23BAC1_11590 [soil metagenome]